MHVSLNFIGYGKVLKEKTAEPLLQNVIPYNMPIAKGYGALAKAAISGSCVTNTIVLPF